ncbi:MAG: preprotein translocase subunit YajC [Alphaproteobacteria bacterium]
MLITPAFAQVAGGGDGSLFVSLMPLFLIFAVFYFLLIRPQQRKAKQHREMLGQLRRGDRVITGGGIIGTVTRVKPEDPELTVEIADGVRVLVARGTISSVLSKPEPARAGGASAGDAAKPGAGKPPARGLLDMLMGGGKK